MNIPDQAFRDLMRISGAATRQEAVRRAVEEFIQRHGVANRRKCARALKEFVPQGYFAQTRMEAMR